MQVMFRSSCSIIGLRQKNDMFKLANLPKRLCSRGMHCFSRDGHCNDDYSKVSLASS